LLGAWPEHGESRWIVENPRRWIQQLVGRAQVCGRERGTARRLL
jgi:hypothetical protein